MVGQHSYPYRIQNAVIMAILILISLTCLLPLIYTLSLSLSDKAAAEAGRVGLLPVNFTLASYQKVLEEPEFFRAFWVSIERVVLGVGLSFVLTLLAAYPLSKEPSEFRGRTVYAWLFIFTMLFNGGIIPWYMNIKNLGLIDSIWALVLPTAVPVFNIILLMNFFRGLPKDLNEAAVIDGAGPWLQLLKIYLPLSLPSIATVTLFTAVGHWNAFFDGLVLMNRPEHYPLQTYIQSLVVQFNANTIASMDTQSMINAMKVSNRTFNAAKIFIAMIPVLLVYPFIQRYFVHGITLGSVKE